MAVPNNCVVCIEPRSFNKSRIRYTKRYSDARVCVPTCALIGAVAIRVQTSSQMAIGVSPAVANCGIKCENVNVNTVNFAEIKSI